MTTMTVIGCGLIGGSMALSWKKAGIVDWHNTALRLEGEDRAEIAALAAEISETWKRYSDPSVDILASTEEGLM